MRKYLQAKKLKQKAINYYMLNGGKQTSENNLLKTLKSIQKSNKQSHIAILKLATLSSIPLFRVIKLKRKYKKKKNSQNKEVPIFVSNYNFRVSWAWKFIIEASKKELNSSHNNLEHEIVLNSKHKGKTVTLKQELQKQALENKKFSRYYRW